MVYPCLLDKCFCISKPYLLTLSAHFRSKIPIIRFALVKGGNANFSLYDWLVISWKASITAGWVDAVKMYVIKIYNIMKHIHSLGVERIISAGGESHGMHFVNAFSYLVYPR